MSKQMIHLNLLLLSFVLRLGPQGAVLAQTSALNKSTTPFKVGVLLDTGSLIGSISWICMSMAIDEFYGINPYYTTRLALHLRDSGDSLLGAVSTALDLLGNEQVQAIIGPQNSAQADFVSNLGSKSQVPIISFSATSPSLSSMASPYFLQATLNDSSQVTAISSIIKAFGWREVVAIYEDTDYGRDVIPCLFDALLGIDARILYRSMIHVSATDDQIKEELYMLMTMQTRVFIIHMSLPMGSRLLSKAKEVGMMDEGYVWIMTDGLTNLVDSMDPSVIDSMQGALGVRPYVPKSRDIDEFGVRWRRRFHKENPGSHVAEPGILGLRAYDTVWALAMAVEEVGAEKYYSRKPNITNNNSLGFEALGVFSSGPKLLKAILENKFRGISGEFDLVDRQLQSSTLQIINVVGGGGRGVGFWTPAYGISRQPNPIRSVTAAYSTSMTDLNPIIWPGESKAIPRGWVIPTSGKKLRIGVPVYPEFVNVERDPVTNETTAVTGYCIDVFEAALQKLPYAIPYEYTPFENTQGQLAGSYDDLVHQVYLQKYDAVVGDTTIRENRAKYVDFTLPYTESGVAILVPVKSDVINNAWIFLKPLSMNLWLGSFAFFFFTGFVVWVMEHRINFPTTWNRLLLRLLDACLCSQFREKMQNILSRLVVIIWVFVVLILSSSYTASLSSMLTVQRPQPTVADLNQLLKNGDYVGYHNNSFVKGLLKQLNFSDLKLLPFDNPEDYVEALSKGSKNGGVVAVFDEIPYLKLFLAQHCTGYAMVGPTFKTAGFGFVFPKGSPLIPDISRAILNLTQGDYMVEIEKKWFKDQTACLNLDSPTSSNSLNFHNFWGLFLITGAASACAVLIFLTIFFYKNWHELKKIDPDKPIWRKLLSWAKYYDTKEENSDAFRKDKSNDVIRDASVSSRNAASSTEFLTIDDDSQSESNISTHPVANPCPTGDQTARRISKNKSLLVSVVIS